MDSLVGTVLDNTYRIEKILGQGGMGAVFRAHDIALNRPVAIKVMHSHIAQQPGFRERFLQEARAIAALDHPGIVQIYSFSREPTLLYIAMAFVQGQNLGDWLQVLAERDMVVSLPEALAIVESVAESLAYAHRRGVFHRDIKPGNIILRPLEPGQSSPTGLAFQPVVTDFGLAKLSEGGIMSMPGTSMGTPAYMAPEQCEGREIDGRADVYALGVVLYELVTGRLPFAVRTLTEAIRAHTQETPPPPRSIDAAIPSQLEQIILKAMAKRPEQRYQAADELGQAVRGVRLSAPQPAPQAPTATEVARASLATMMGEEIAPARPSSELWPTPPSQPTPGGQIVIMLPDGSTRALAIGGRQRVNIGRDADNDIALADNQVSRHHAQIVIAENRYTVTDLNSTNGTWLDNNKLLPGVAETWRPAQTLRVGGHWLKLQVAAAGVSAEPPPGAATYAPSAPAAAEELIQVTLEPAVQTVRAGTPAVLTARLLNRQQQVDHLAVSVEGLPAPWVAAPEQPLRLAPGDTGTLTLRITPPRSPEARAGLHEYVVRVRSQSSPGYSVAAQGRLTIEPFREIALDLAPRTITNGGQVRVSIGNTGNAPEAVVLSVEDPDDALRAPGASSPLTVPPGGQQLVALPLEMRGKRPFMGSVETHSFGIAALANNQRVAAAQGTLRVKPRFPTWAIPLITTLALLLCAGAALVYSNVQRDRSATATAQALVVVGQTQTMEARGEREQTQIAATQATAEAQATGTQSAVEAAALAAEAAVAATAQAATVAALAAPTATTEAPPTPTATETATPTLTPTATPTPLFGSGEAKGFAVQNADVGVVTQVCLQHDNTGPSPDWFVDRVLVSKGAGYQEFLFGRWIAVDKEDGSLLVCSEPPTPTPQPSPTRTNTPSGGGAGIILLNPTILAAILPTPTPSDGLIFLLPGLVLTPQILLPTIVFAPLMPLADYDILVMTGPVVDGGTSAAVSIRLIGSTRSTDWFPLTP
jgi:serine/threonine protein kinase